jgi:hypothetical protein
VSPEPSSGGAESVSPKTRQLAAGRVARVMGGTRAFIRIVYRDPEHIAERMALYASDRLGEPSREWAAATLEANPDVPRVKLADDLRNRTAAAARIEGAVAGTPFLIALAPGYLSYLWQEGRMGLRTAALYGRDPTDLSTTAEMLTLRGVHPTPEQAEAALRATRDELPEKPTERRSLRTWVRSVRALLVFGGFLSLPSEKEEAPVRYPKLKATLGLAVGTAIWVMTWVLPLTFMVAMAWACESHARELGRRVLAYYDGESDSARAAIEAAERKEDRGHDRRQLLRSVALFLSVAIPIGFVALANHYKQETGFSWVAALGALVALSLVIATAVIVSRR